MADSQYLCSYISDEFIYEAITHLDANLNCIKLFSIGETIGRLSKKEEDKFEKVGL